MPGKRGVRLTPLRGERFWFDPGARCLEFGLTGGEGYRAAYETLHTAGDLGYWIRGAFGVAVDPVTDQDLAEARRFREAIWQSADALVINQPLPLGAVAELNRAAAEPPLAPQIDHDGHRRWVTPVTAGQVLSTLARDAVDLFTGPHSRRIRRCAGPNCYLIFADTSRAGGRRWCSMERCGNRAKVRTFRNRHQKEESP